MGVGDFRLSHGIPRELEWAMRISRTEIEAATTSTEQH